MLTTCRDHYTFTAELWLPHAPEYVFEFFSDAHNLEAITPPMLKFNVLTPPPIVMAEGTLIDYKLKVRGVPLRWTSRITAWDPPHRFVDEQVRGPYKLWRHEHTFTPYEGGTLARDRVDFLSRGWLLAPLLHRLLVNRDVQAIFDYRTTALRERFASESEAKADSFKNKLFSL